MVAQKDKSFKREHSSTCEQTQFSAILGSFVKGICYKKLIDILVIDLTESYILYINFVNMLRGILEITGPSFSIELK